MERARNTKVFVGLSGGVDSAVSAALLQRQGYDVTGVFIKTWHPDFLPCNWKAERLDAMRIAAQLDIPFLTLDLEQEYKTEVAERMIEEYRKGRTPNPDTLCNKEIKFGGFLRFAREHGAMVATGHYARIERVGDEVHILAGLDGNKDQSYFLWMVRGEDVRDIVFPIGHLHKSDVRDLARSFNLPNAQKKDSQGICFLGDVSIEDFLGHFIDLKRGDVLDAQGKKIGTHPGSILFALGQRHGFTVPGSQKPLYVVGKDAARNTVTVAETAPQESLHTTVRVAQENWIGSVEPGACMARLRYREPLRNAELSWGSDGVATVTFREATLIPLGQSLVLYRGDRMLGGGILDSAL